MNYKNLYDKFVSHCQSTDPRKRMLERNQHDFRLQYDSLYTEVHHIIPRSVGGTDVDTNLVVLLPEEHLFAHRLRYKAYNDRGDFIAVRFIINGIKNHPRYGNIPAIISNKVRSSYAWIKQNSSDFRLNHGWQTEDGIRRISESRKDTFPVKCIITGDIMGSFDKNHPKILSGEWVHHSKGNHTYHNKVTGERMYCSINDERLNDDWSGATSNTDGENNSRFSGITNEDFLEEFILLSNKLKNIPSFAFFRKVYMLKTGIQFPKSLSKYRFNSGKDLFPIVEERTGYKREIHQKWCKDLNPIDYI